MPDGVAGRGGNAIFRAVRPHRAVAHNIGQHDVSHSNIIMFPRIAADRNTRHRRTNKNYIKG
jgi:hypothetical protein